MRILISGASIAGPVAAYWLTRYGFDVTVVERSPSLRKTGGHAVDLFRPAMAISESMGVAPRIEAHKTGTARLTLYRETSSRPAILDYEKLLGVASDRRVEIMRDDLSEIYYDASRDAADYLFGDEITSISGDGEVTFAHSPSQRYDVIVGADGLHSGVRRLVFGPDAGHSEFLGSCLAVASVPKSFADDDDSTGYVGPNRLAMVYTARSLDDARAVFLFRPRRAPDYDHRDTEGMKAILRSAFTGFADQVDTWLDELDRTPAFYFDSITQLQRTTWSSGRVTLVGDAGYCPGPAVGGSTSLAVIGAYVLAGELDRCRGDYASAFAAYEQVMAEPVRHSRALARRMATALIPSSALGVRALTSGTHLISLLPTAVTRRILALQPQGLRMHDNIRMPTYPAPGRIG